MNAKKKVVPTEAEPTKSLVDSIVEIDETMEYNDEVIEINLKSYMGTELESVKLEGVKTATTTGLARAMIKLMQGTQHKTSGAIMLSPTRGRTGIENPFFTQTEYDRMCYHMGLALPEPYGSAIKKDADPDLICTPFETANAGHGKKMVATACSNVRASIDSQLTTKVEKGANVPKHWTAAPIKRLRTFIERNDKLSESKNLTGESPDRDTVSINVELGELNARAKELIKLLSDRNFKS